MKKLLLIMTAIFALTIVGCSNKENKKSEPTAVDSVSTASAAVTPAIASTAVTPAVASTAPTATPAKILTPKVSAKIDYTILEEFKVFKQDKGYGALILISPDASKDDIIDLLKKIGESKDPVAVEVFSSHKAYEAYLNSDETEEFKKGYIASYAKNKSLSDMPLYGENSITWTQEVGKFSSFQFTTTSMDN